LSVIVSDSPEPNESPGPFADVQKLREALIAFLNDEHADWEALSRDLQALAAASPASEQKSQVEFADLDEARDAWRQLADFLAHADRAQGVPPQVRRLLESDVAARVAAAAFAESLSSQRAAWLDFAAQIARSRKTHP
jgi:hypothetical protein